MGARYAVIGAEVLEYDPRWPPLLTALAETSHQVLELEDEEEEQLAAEKMANVAAMVSPSGQESSGTGAQHLSRYLTLPARSSGRLASKHTEVCPPLLFQLRTHLSIMQATL